MKSAVSGRVSKLVMMVVGTVESVDSCASKTASDVALFWCRVTAWGCELAVVQVVGGRETSSLWVG